MFLIDLFITSLLFFLHCILPSSVLFCFVIQVRSVQRRCHADVSPTGVKEVLRCSVAWTMHLLDDASLGQCVPRTMRPLDDASLGRCISWTMRPLDDASLGRCVAWTMHLLEDAHLGLCVPGRCVPILDCIQSRWMDDNHDSYSLLTTRPCALRTT
jgi:hypothetical protein